MKALWCRLRGHRITVKFQRRVASVWCARCDHQITLVREGEAFPPEVGFDPFRAYRDWSTPDGEVWVLEQQTMGPLVRALRSFRCTLFGHDGFWRRDVLTLTSHHECRDCREVFGQVLTDEILMAAKG